MKITNLITGERVRCRIEKTTREDIVKSKQHFAGIVQAFFSMREDDGFIYMSLLERANYKAIKVYDGITKIAFGFACLKSFESGFEGFVSFQPKTKLADYYRLLVGAVTVGESQRMFIDTERANELIALLDEEET